MSKTNDIAEARRRDVISALENGIIRDSWSYNEAFRVVVKSAAPRFYITPKQAYQVILPLIRGDFSELEKMAPQRQRMYRALYDIVLELAQQPAHRNTSLWNLMPWAVSSPAPEFYMSPIWARQIWMEELKGKRYKPVFKKKLKNKSVNEEKE